MITVLVFMQELDPTTRSRVASSSWLDQQDQGEFRFRSDWCRALKVELFQAVVAAVSDDVERVKDTHSKAQARVPLIAFQVSASGNRNLDLGRLVVAKAWGVRWVDLVYKRKMKMNAAWKVWRPSNRAELGRLASGENSEKCCEHMLLGKSDIAVQN